MDTGVMGVLLENAVFLFVPVVLIVSYLFGDHHQLKKKTSLKNLRSFAAGVAVSYVFLILIPEANEMGEQYHIRTMLLMLMGFVFFHSLIKYAFKKKDHNVRIHLVDEIHLVVVATYNFVITFSLIELSKNNIVEGMFLLLLIALHAILSEMTHRELHHEENQYFKQLTIYTAIAFGAIMPVFGLVTQVLRAVIFAFTAGAMIYITIREELPNGPTGRPRYFLIGVIVLVVGVLLIEAVS